MTLICSNCKKKVNESSGFCGNCGVKLDETTTIDLNIYRLEKFRKYRNYGIYTIIGIIIIVFLTIVTDLVVTNIQANQVIIAGRSPQILVFKTSHSSFPFFLRKSMIQKKMYKNAFKKDDRFAYENALFCGYNKKYKEKAESRLKDIMKETGIRPDREGKYIDPRDNQEYRWAKIGKQIWLAEDLNYAGIISDPVNTNSNRKGRYYSSATMKRA